MVFLTPLVSLALLNITEPSNFTDLHMRYTVSTLTGTPVSLVCCKSCSTGDCRQRRGALT